jgi:hypothetical protein
MRDRQVGECVLRGNNSDNDLEIKAKLLMENMLLPNDPYSRTERCEVITDTTMDYIYDSLTTTSVSFELVACSLQTEADEQEKMRERNRRHHTPQSAVALQSDQMDVAKKEMFMPDTTTVCPHVSSGRVYCEKRRELARANVENAGDKEMDDIVWMSCERWESREPLTSWRVHIVPRPDFGLHGR